MRTRTGLWAFALCCISGYSQENYAQWKAYRAVTLNTTATGANVPEVLRYPLLVRLNSSTPDVFSGAATGGADLRFTKADGMTRIKHYVERWDSAGMAAEVWVLIDTVAGNNNTQSFRMYWGKADAADSSQGGAVFETANGFALVWHLQETGNAAAGPGTPGLFKDATANALHGTGQSMGPLDLKDANIGKGQDFVPSSSIQVANVAALNPTNRFTLSAWIKADTWGTTATNRRVVEKGLTDNQYRIKKKDGADSLEFSAAGLATNTAVRTALPSTGAWHYVAGVYDGANLRMYLDGVQSAVKPATGNMAATVDALALGGKPGSQMQGDFFDGMVDELRVSSIARGPNTTKLDFESQKIGSTMVALGSAVVQDSVAAPSGLAYAANPAAYVAGVAITPNAATVTGQSVRFSVAPPLPAGLSLDTVTGTISGTPAAASAAADFTVTARNSAGSTTAVVNIAVTGGGVLPPSELKYAVNPVAYRVGAAITPNPATVVGTDPRFSVAPALPAGLSLDSVTGRITGTPTTVAAGANFVVTARNSAGFTSGVLNITVTANVVSPSGLKYAVNPATYAPGAAILPNTVTVVGTDPRFSVAPPLPAGLSLDSITGVVTGTPAAASAAADFTVTARNAGGSTTAVLRIAVSAVVVAPSNLSYAVNPAIYGAGTPILANTPTVAGTSPRFSVAPPLPAGLSLDSLTGAVTGTPVAPSAAAGFTVTARNSAGTTTVLLNITVRAGMQPPANLVYPESTSSYEVGTNIFPNSPSFEGDAVRFTVAPPLPAGLRVDSLTGEISGTPAAASLAKNYTITAKNGGGSITAVLNITVFGIILAPYSLDYAVDPATYNVGTAIDPNIARVQGTDPRFSVNPPLPAGLALDTITGRITGTPLLPSPSTVYEVMAANSAGSVTIDLVLEVQGPVALAAGPAYPAFTVAIPGLSPLRFHLPADAVQVEFSLVDLRGRAAWTSRAMVGKGWGLHMQVGAARTLRGVYVARLRTLGPNRGRAGGGERKLVTLIGN